MDTLTTHKRFYRSSDAVIGGVCAGIADYFDMDALVVRILAIMLLMVTLGLGFFVYVALWVHVPLEPQPVMLYDVRPETAELSYHGDNLEYFLNTTSSGEDEWISKPIRGLPIVARLGIAVGLLALFLGLALSLSPLVPGVSWWQFWPLLLFILGLFFIVIPIRSTRKAAWHAGGVISVALAVTLFPMSVSIVSWDSIGYSFSLLWPIFIVSIALFVVGLVRDIDALVMAGAFCFVVFCIASSILCVLPGQLEALEIMLFEDRVIKVPLSLLSLMS